MSCDFVVPRLSPHLDGELPELEASVVRDHLAHCPACGGRYHLLADTGDAYRALPQAAATPVRRRWTWAAGIAAALAILVTRVPPPPAAGPPLVDDAAIPGLDCGRPAATVCHTSLPCSGGTCAAGAAPGLHAGLAAGFWEAPGAAGL